MPAFYKIDQERRFFLSSGSGTLTLADAKTHQQKLSNDPDFDPSFSPIWHFIQFTQFDLSSNEILQMAERSVFSSPSRRAFIAPNDFAFGLASRKPWTGFVQEHKPLTARVSVLDSTPLLM